VDYDANTMTLRGQIPGITASAQFGFWCWDAVTQSLDRLDERESCLQPRYFGFLANA
jgi:hypothetical protein